MIKVFARLVKFSGLCEEECIFCGAPIYSEDQGYFCNVCLEHLKPHHPLEYRKLEYVSSYRVFGRYEGVLKSLILSAKFRANVSLARSLGKVISPYLWEYIEIINPDLITCPGVNIRRYWSRGFNHTEEMLRGAGVPFVKVFKRIGLGGISAGLSKEERLRAVKSHKLREEVIDLLEDKKVLIFDDVLTTGATITRLAELVLSVGASEVYAFFVAQAL